MLIDNIPHSCRLSASVPQAVHRYKNRQVDSTAHETEQGEAVDDRSDEGSG